MGVRAAGPVGLILVVLALASACTSTSSTSAASSSSSSSSSLDAAAPAEANAAAAAPDATGGSGASSGTGGGPTGKPGAGAVVAAPVRSVIMTASVSLRLDVAGTGRGAEADQAAVLTAVNQAAVRVRSLAGPDGYVSASDGSGSAVSITLRVAPTGYRQVFAGLDALGTITQQTEKADDVTGALVDLTSRMQTMKASVDRVRLLLSKADKVGDVIAIESELTKREADLESLERQQAALAGQVGLSTITVAMTAAIAGSEPVAAARARSGFLGGLADGWHALTGFLGGVAVVLGAVLPFLPFVALAGLIWLTLARRQRRLNEVRSARIATGPGDAR